MPDPWNGVPPGEWAEQVTDTLLGWLTGPDSGQNDGIMDAIALIRALSADLAAQIAAAVMAEREACAALCEERQEAYEARAMREMRLDGADPEGASHAASISAAMWQSAAGLIRSRPAPAGVDALAERDRAVRRAALEDAARVASRIGRPAGAGDGDTYVPGSAADAARAIRALMEADDA